MAAFPGQRAENRLADDWPIYVAFMPAVVIGIAAAICFSTASLHDRTLSNAAGVKSTQGDTDDFEGLARLGIGLIDERVPAVAAMIDDVVEGFEDAVRQPVLTHELPDVFLAVELGRARRQRQERDVARNREGAMPSGLIEE